MTGLSRWSSSSRYQASGTASPAQGSPARQQASLRARPASHILMAMSGLRLVSRKRPRQTLLLLATVATVLMGLVLWQLLSNTPHYRVATWQQPANVGSVPVGRASTKVGGILGGRTNADGRACTWLGSGSDAVALVWPPGYSARGNPLTIFNEKGNAVATVGKLANLDGSVAAPESMQGRPILGCPLMSSVELVAPIE